MTKRELYDHLELQNQLTAATEMLASLEAAAGPRAQLLDGMPHAPGVHDCVGNLATEIADTRTGIEALRAKITHSETAVAACIGTIGDLQTRMIFRLRFICGFTWKEVAALIGGSNTECSVKNICYRYMKANLK